MVAVESLVIQIEYLLPKAHITFWRQFPTVLTNGKTKTSLLDAILTVVKFDPGASFVSKCDKMNNLAILQYSKI